MLKPKQYIGKIIFNCFRIYKLRWSLTSSVSLRSFLLLCNDDDDDEGSLGI